MSVVFAVFAALSYGIGDYCGARASKSAPSILVTLVGQVCSLALLVVMLAAFADPVAPGGDWTWGAVGGLGGFAGLAIFYYALSRGAMTVVAPVIDRPPPRLARTSRWASISVAPASSTPPPAVTRMSRPAARVLDAVPPTPPLLRLSVRSLPARTALLDGFLAVFVVAAFGALMVDRDQVRQRLDAALAR